MARSAEDDGAPAFKRARTQDASPAPLDPMAETQAQLQRSTDPHLQAKLLLDYSAQAVAPEANTEAAIDFLFAFLQQSQTASGADKEGDGTKSPPSAKGGRGSGSNAVVVAAIVRGLRGLLAVNPGVVEPMIQLDAMGEQLTQCVSVPEDFKLRRDMLRIVLDCLVLARKLTHTEQLLKACMDDHDDGLRAICLDGYIRLLNAGYRVQAAAVGDLIARLCRMLAVSDDAHSRELAARALGRLVTSVEEEGASVSAQETILNALASNARDPLPRVRREIAIAFRRFAGGSLAEPLFLHLLQKTQINEDLSEIDSQSVVLLTNGAMLTLMEDEDEEVATEASTSVRMLCEVGAWGSDLIDRAVSSHVELAARAARYREQNLLAVLTNLRVLLEISKTKEGDSYPLSREELFYLVGSLPTNSPLVTLAVIKISPLLTIDHAYAATRIVTFIIQCSAISCSAEVDANLAAEEVRHAMGALGTKWIHDGVSLPASTVADLRDAALAQGGTSPVAEACRVLHDALCSPSDRLDSFRHPQTSLKSIPSFLGASGTTAKSREECDSSRPLVTALVRQISDSLLTLQRTVARDSGLGLGHGQLFSSAVMKTCEKLRESCHKLLARTQHFLDSKAKSILVELLFVAEWARTTTTSDLKTLFHHALTVKHISLEFQSTIAQLQHEELAGGREAHFGRLVSAVSTEELKRWLGDSKLHMIATASITHPDEVAACVVHEVSSQLPFALRVQCVIRNVPEEAAIFVKARVPSGELTYTPLHTKPRVGSDEFKAEATIELHFRPFSDPSQLDLAVCLEAPRVFPSDKTNMEGEDYVEISSVVKLQVQHRLNPALRHQNSRSG